MVNSPPTFRPSGLMQVERENSNYLLSE